MARGSHDKAMKEMVSRVKELCKDADDNAIQILLQQYDFNVDQTVQAFLDGKAAETLQEWKSLGGSAKTASSKKKKKNKNKNSANSNGDATSSQPIPNANHVTSDRSGLCNGTANGLNGGLEDKTELPQVKQQQTRVQTSNQQQTQKHTVQQSSRPKEDYKLHTKKGTRDRTLSEASTSSGIDKSSKNPHAILEKSLKDLQRQTVSLQRLKVVLNEQVDKSFKRVSEVFKELHNQLNEREAQLIFEMDKVKTEANNILEDQQRKAGELKLLTDRAQVMKEAEITDLRSRIKYFVSDRKHYEDLCQTQRFVCDFNHILEELKKFGQVVPIKLTSDPRRASIASLGSSISHEETPSFNRMFMAPATSTSPFQSAVSNHQPPPSASLAPSVAAAASSTAPSAPAVSSTTVFSTAAVPPAFVPNSAHVLMQSESLTKYEALEMANRLANLSVNDSKSSSAVSSFKSPRGDRGHGSRGRGGRNSAADNERSAKTNSNEQQRDGQSSRGSRGGRSQGKSNKGEGGNVNHSTASSHGSNELKDTSSQTQVNTDITIAAQGSSNRHAEPIKSPRNEPRRGSRRGDRKPDDSLTKLDTSEKLTHNSTEHHDDSSAGDAKKTSAPNNNNEDSLPTSNKPLPNVLTNGAVEALPQRGTRSNQRGRAGGTKQATDNRPTQKEEPVLANGM